MEPLEPPLDPPLMQCRVDRQRPARSAEILGRLFTLYDTVLA